MRFMINCPYYSLHGEQSVCQVVADLMERPLSECHTNPAACRFCLECGIPPQVPNPVTASMAIGVAIRTQDQGYMKATMDRFKNNLLKAPPPVTTCVLRGPEIRQVACKPCQADSLVPVMKPVYRCPKHGECTLHNTGTFPKIKACVGCGDRLEQYVQLDAKVIPPEVIQAMSLRRPR
jgi:hypothetical protein